MRGALGVALLTLGSSAELPVTASIRPNAAAHSLGSRRLLTEGAPPRDTCMLPCVLVGCVVVPRHFCEVSRKMSATPGDRVLLLLRGIVKQWHWLVEGLPSGCAFLQCEGSKTAICGPRYIHTSKRNIDVCI